MPIFRRGRQDDGDTEPLDAGREGPPTDFSFDALLPVRSASRTESVQGVDVPLELDLTGPAPAAGSDPGGEADGATLVRSAAAATVVPGLARPRGAYPHGRRAGPFFFVSGIGARQPDNSIRGARADAMGTASLDIREQTRAVIENVRAVLKSAGMDLADLVEITTYLVHMNDFGGYNEVYGQFFGVDGPARTTVAVHQLPHPHMLIEMKAVAYRP